MHLFSNQQIAFIQCGESVAVGSDKIICFQVFCWLLYSALSVN